MNDRQRSNHRRRRQGPIKRVIRGLADAFGLPRGIVIAGFVLGFVFVPLLSVLAFLAALYWMNNPERTRRHIDFVSDSLRRVGDRFRRGAAGPKGRATEDDSNRHSRESPRPTMDPTTVYRRFERLERRARAIEEFVASEEFRLNREFRRMGRS